MNIKIKHIKETTIKGVNYSFTNDDSTYKERYFEWTGFSLITPFHSSNIMNGLLQGWHHTPEFTQIEFHEDYEQFYFYENDCLMLFIEIENHEPLMETAQIVYIPQGTQLDIAPNTGHFVPVAVNDTFKAVVTSPNQEAPRIDLPEKITGIY